MTEISEDLADGRRNRRHGFLAGLLAGGLAGVAAVVWFSPDARGRLRTLRGRAVDSAEGLGRKVTTEYRRATARVAGAARDVRGKSRGAYGKGLTVVAAAAHEVEGKAIDAKAALERDGTPLA